jgi:DHA2 family multidrug resistance protein
MSMTGPSITGSKVGITIAAMAAALMAILDISIVNVALSDIRASFGTPLDQIAWVSTGYMMANVVVIPMTGWLQRRFGFRKYFTGSIILFIIASALCGMSWNLGSLVAFRILQGCGGGAIIPTAQSLLFARYPKEEHGMAGALFGIGAMTGPLLGPTLGGYLIDVSSWHWIFLINVPIGLFAAFMAWRSIEEPGYERPAEGIDRNGIALLAVGMASLQYVLEEGNRDNWFESPTIAVLAALAFVSLITFVVHELEADNPVVDLRVFKNRSYTAATGINFLIGTALFSGGFLFSLYCGAIMHYKALDIGLLFLKGSAIQLLLMPLIGKFGSRFDSRALVAFGVCVLTVSLWMNGSFSSQSSDFDLIKPVFVRAVGLCFIFVPLSVIALSDLSPQLRGSATGLFNLTRELGGSIGTAAMSSLLSHDAARAYQALSENVSGLNPLAREQLAATQAGIGWKLFDPASGALTIMQGRLNQQALIRSFNENFTMLALIFAGSLALIFMLKRPRSGVEIQGAH